MSKLGVGVVGVGEMGKRHAENLARFVPKARLVAIADPDLERARSVARELEIERYYSTVEDLVAHKDVQAVVIVSPAKFHPQGVKVAAAAGKDILCEKPLALTLEEADAARTHPLRTPSRAGNSSADWECEDEFNRTGGRQTCHCWRQVRPGADAADEAL